MKLVCELEVRSQLLPNSAKKACACTLALCKDKKDLPIILACTKKNIAGQKYEVKSLQKVFSKFVKDGMTTLSFSAPPHDLLIRKADPLQLRSFLHVLSNNGKCKMHFSAPPTRIEAPAPKKMIINKRGDLPTVFPKTLEFLTITDIGLLKVLSSVTSLTKLTMLSLSGNAIESLPSPILHSPGLKVLDLSKNRLKALQGISDLKMLQQLDVSSNQLSVLPESICNLRALFHLNIADNMLEGLPHAIGKLRRLNVLRASRNRIKVLPSSFLCLNNLTMLDLFENPLDQQCTESSECATFLPSLKQWAAEAVLIHRLPYSPESLPVHLVDYLRIQNNYCSRCSRPVCSDIPPKVVKTDLLKLNIQTVTAIDTRGRTMVSAEVTNCFRDMQRLAKRKQILNRNIYV